MSIAQNELLTMHNLPHIPKPTVSIGMFVYNGAMTLRDAIDSMLNQTFLEFELIISDNASTDGTEGICREYKLYSLLQSNLWQL